MEEVLETRVLANVPLSRGSEAARCTHRCHYPVDARYDHGVGARARAVAHPETHYVGRRGHTQGAPCSNGGHAGAVSEAVAGVGEPRVAAGDDPHGLAGGELGVRGPQAWEKSGSTTMRRPCTSGATTAI